MVYPEIVVAGCGNPLYGDDGFGPAVAQELHKFSFPDHIMVIDAGMSAPEQIFPLLDPAITKKLIIVDIADFCSEPGSVTLLRPSDFPHGGIRDAHNGGIIGSLHNIREGFEITIIGCQPGRITDPAMEIGLSEEVKNAIPKTIRIIQALIGMTNTGSMGKLPEITDNRGKTGPNRF